MNTQLIKIIEKPILKTAEQQEELEQQFFPSDTINTQEPAPDTKQVLNVEHQEPHYIPVRDRPTVQSVGNSGWQVSDIWRDIRVDDFCNG
ncbi:hypothetical protein [Fischerella sp. PCC 9605]|uniref:hypothetical protein n=1 Tax=Fischerella sp. PCC 9605 TaxID=1173024 RepID=UPI0004797768|nr:hypothetical protein [Fischerella sp. PCC 9605]